MLNITKSLLKKYKFDLIFLSTEEKDYLNIFLKISRKIVYFSNPRTIKKIYLIIIINIIDIKLVKETS